MSEELVSWPDDLGRYPLAGVEVSGLVVRHHIPNRSSIEASITNFQALPRVREISFPEFTGPGPITERIRKLAAEIEASGEINPLIVVDEGDGPYILEGSHRFDALQLLGKPTFPALVIIDLDNPPVLKSSGPRP